MTATNTKKRPVNGHQPKGSAMKNKVSLAGQQNTRVIIVRSPETHDLLNILSQADVASHRLRFSGDPSALGPYFEAIGAFEAAVKALCVSAALPYDVVRKAKN